MLCYCYVILVVPTWKPHCVHMKTTSCPHGNHMVFTWKPHVFTWKPHVSTWKPCGVHMEITWCSHGNNMVSMSCLVFGLKLAWKQWLLCFPHHLHKCKWLLLIPHHLRIVYMSFLSLPLMEMTVLFPFQPNLTPKSCDHSNQPIRSLHLLESLR